MVAKEKIPLGGIEFFIEPANKIRRLLEHWHIYLPYLHGAKPKFKLVLSRLSDTQQISSVYWCMEFSNGHKTIDELKIPTLVTRETRELEIGDKLLGYTGNTAVGITLLRNKKYYTLYSFRTVAQEDLTVAALITLFACFLATIIALWLV